MIVLFLSNVRDFREKMGGKPPGMYLLAYEGEGVLICEGRRLYECFIDPYDTGNVGLVAAVISDSMGSESKEESSCGSDAALCR